MIKTFHELTEYEKEIVKENLKDLIMNNRVSIIVDDKECDIKIITMSVIAPMSAIGKHFFAFEINDG